MSIASVGLPSIRFFGPVVLLLTGFAAASEAETVSVIPRPVTLTMKEGRFLFKPGTVIRADPALAEEARLFARTLAPALGFTLEVRTSRVGSAPHVVLKLDPALERLGEEGYSLEISSKRIVLKAPRAAGIFYGTQTLRQLLPVQVYRQAKMEGVDWSVPCLLIEDSPRFKWRGAMLDVSRHFMPKEFVKKYIDLLAIHKMNSFHWHLTDDTGWRIEIKKYPKLTEVGSWREASPVGPIEEVRANQKSDGKPHFGFYTQEDVREVVAYARERHINVVPEIEMPGHSQASVAAYPELGSLGKPVPVLFNYDLADQLNMDEPTIQFMFDVLSEVISLFPSRYVHVGGDEVEPKFWQQSARVQARMKELGVGNEKELQGYFTRRLDEFLTGKGRQLIGWDEILEGGISKNAVVMSWRGEQGGIQAANAGHDVVMAPTDYTYFDYYQDQPDKEPLAIGGLLPLEKVYSYDPVPAAIAAANAHHVLGAQCQLWTEFVPDRKHAEYMTFPRLCALAEDVWTPKEQKDYAEFLQRLAVHFKRLDVLDVNYRKLVPESWSRVK
ncbi:MAG TPA: beta-N-acetylhexosaminidase [Terriglobia bacterium]|nr:beta-N-acetylhexosaminidase [Terriglobia bacterium]